MKYLTLHNVGTKKQFSATVITISLALLAQSIGLAQAIAGNITTGRQTAVRIAHVAVEFDNVIKGGVGNGVGQVVEPLAAEQATRGHNVEVFLPYFTKLLAYEGSAPELIHDSLQVTLPNGRKETFQLWQKPTARGVGPYLIAHPVFSQSHFYTYAPLQGHGLFHEFYRHAVIEGKDIFNELHAYASGDGQFDRAMFFAAAAKVAVGHVMGRPDLVHFHDWPAAAGPYLFRDVPTVFTVHNATHTGPFTIREGLHARVSESALLLELLDQGGPNLLRLGLLTATKITTVSRRYRSETLGQEGGGNEKAFRLRRGDYHGILNGVDIIKWNSLTNPHLARNYGVEEALIGKRANKIDLQQKLGLAVDADAPLALAIARIAKQKGLDFLDANLDWLFASGAQVVIMGNVAPGDSHGVELAHKFQSRLARNGRRQFAFIPFKGHEHYEALADAAADIFLMPSRFEPGGLANQIAMRFGAVVVGPRVGGIADALIDFDRDPVKGNGILIGKPSARALLFGLKRALAILRNPARRARIITNAMTRDASWGPPANLYDQVYREAMAIYAESQS